jgi:hypothetical protein
MSSPQQATLFDPNDLRETDAVKKSVRLLAITKASKGISLTARQLFEALLAIARREESESAEKRDYYLARLVDIGNVIQYSSKDYAPLKRALSEMIGTKVEWASPTPTENTVIYSGATLLAAADVIRTPAGNVIKWSYGHNIKEELMKPEVWASFRWGSLLALRSVPAHALYQIVGRYEGIGRTPPFPKAWLYEALKEHPGDGRQMPAFKTWNRDVLKKALAQVNVCTELDVEPDFLPHRRKQIDFIQFRIRVKPRAVHDAEPLNLCNPADAQLIGRARGQGIAEHGVASLVAQHGKSRVSDGLSALEQRVAKTDEQGPVKNVTRYVEGVLARRLKNEAAPKLADATREAASQPDTPPSNIPGPEQERLQEIEQRRSDAMERYLVETPSEKSRIQVLFQESDSYIRVMSPTLKKAWLEKGMASKFPAQMFRAFLLQHYFGKAPA